MASELLLIAERALEFVSDGNVVGLGTGRAATSFIKSLGARVQAGLRIRGVPTSLASADLARELQIPLVSLGDVEAIDVTIDGADEIDPQLNLIKGLGGALVREKIVAAASRRLVIVAGNEKLVDWLGAHGVLPVEVVPFALPLCQRRLAEFGWPTALRMSAGKPFVTDNGNHVLDWQIAPLDRPHEVENFLRALPGVVGTGLFLDMAHTVLIQDGEQVVLKQRTP